MNWDKTKYMESWPKAIPYPYAIQRSREPVPNRSAVDWPQSQFAPLYLKPGSPSVQPYRYPANGPIQSIVPQMYMATPTAFGTKRPAGDTSAVPYQFQEASYADVMDAYSGCGCSGYGDCGCSGSYGDGGCGCGGSCCQGAKAKKNPVDSKILWAAAAVAGAAAIYFLRKK